MAGSKRERELHRAKVAREQKEAAAAAERRRKRLLIGAAIGGTAVVVAAVLGVAVAVGGSDDSPATASGAAASPSPSTIQQTSTILTCNPVNGKKPATKQYKASDYTALKLNDTGVYSETMKTNCGDITFELDSKNAPEMSKAMLFLTDRTKFYDNTTCHRLTTEGIYVLQCGDPKGDGTGGPGFQLAEENLPKAGADGTAVYPKGTIAMANAGAGTTGSQFFLVYKDSPLPPNYTVLGKITKGLNNLEAMAAQGTVDGSGDAAPKQPVQIYTMTSALTTTVAPPS